MDWTSRMNQAMDYVEDHLDGDIDPGRVAQIMACPFEVFQRAFIQITGVPLSEYIRRRRLTCAAHELLGSPVKVIDLALKYGYTSADAFSAAFKRLHGVTPSAARRGDAPLTFYCRLRFALNIEGVDKMDYQLIQRGGFKVIGVRRTTPYGGGTWAVVKGDGSADALGAMNGGLCDLGLCFGLGEDGSNDYMCGIAWEGEDVPGYDSYTYSPSAWLRFAAEGPISQNVLGNLWRRVNQEFLPQSPYEKSGQPTIERYVQWNDAQDWCQMEVWVPVQTRAEGGGR